MKVDTRWPVLLGGAALTRAYVEDDLSDLYDGEVRYARDAFEGLALMDALVAHRRGVPGPELPALRKRRVRVVEQGGDDALLDTQRSDVATDVSIPTPPFWGDRVVRGVALAEYASYLDERATFMGQWGLRSARTDGPTYEELVETEGRPRLREWLDRVQTEGWLEAAVVYGYFPCYSEGNDLVIVHGEGRMRARSGPDYLPAPTSGPSAVHRRLLPSARVRRDRRRCLPCRDHGQPHLRSNR